MKFIRLIGICGLAGAAAVFSCFAAGENSPVGYWLFDEGNGKTISDSSGNNNHGKVANNMRAVTWVNGRNGKALQFSGCQTNRNQNGCVLISNLAGKYNFEKGITIEAWIRPASSMERKAIYEIVTNTESDRGKGFRLRIAWNALMFGSGEGGDGRTWQAASMPARAQIKSETWYHIAGAYDGSVFRVYLDGEEVGASDPNLPLTRGRKDVYIGAYNEGYAYGFEGVIDEVKIYERALSASEILEHSKL